jgi:MEDS: MEthanogen/methylotroph, DcmR Sensory domain
MRLQLRVENPGVLEPHDHVVWYGEDESDLYALASNALAAGAHRREKLMFVAEQPDPDRLHDVGDLEQLLDSGQLELAEIDAVYGTSGRFSASSQLATFEAVLADALGEGYTGIRVVADNTRLARGGEEDFRRWLAWEQVTDRFQSSSNVTGVCYFDRSALSEQRQADLASIHPVRSAGSVEPPFSFFASGDAVSATGTLDTWSADRFQRILETTPADEPLVVDLAHAEFVDHRALLALNAAASARRPVRIRRARRIVRELPALLALPTPHLSFE